MLESDGLEQNGNDKLLHPEGRGRRSPSSSRPAYLHIPKNRSTGNLLMQNSKTVANPRIRFSFDAGQGGPDYEALSVSPIMTEHEHGLGASGLRRIRQQPPPRTPTLPPSTNSSRAASVAPHSSSMSLTPGSRKGSSSAISPGPASPTLFTEDLTRFPSESLHSFSFAHQSEEFIHTRQNILKRSIEFMKDRLGWAASSAGIVSAQARVSGDQEMQSMLELLTRAKLVGSEGVTGHALDLLQGPLTGPAHIEGENVFDKSLFPRSESPELLQSPTSSIPILKKPMKPTDGPLVDGAQKPEQRGGSEGSLPVRTDGGSEVSSRTPTDESRTTAKTSPPRTRRQSLRRAFTDIEPLALQSKLMDAMAQPYITGESYNAPLLSPMSPQFPGPSSYGLAGPHPIGPAMHGYASRWAPATQAIFTTESKKPWTILAANDFACLVFGVTKAEVRKMGILEVVREERRAWLEEKLSRPGSGAESESQPSPQYQSQHGSPPSTTSFLLGRNGLTASLLSKPPSRSITPSLKRAQTDDGAGSSFAARKRATKGNPNHSSNKSRGVLLCGDVVPIQKRNGSTGAASLWVKEKRGGLIWVLEEILEDVAYISLDDDGLITKITGSTEPIWGNGLCKVSVDIGGLIPRIPRQGVDPRTGEIDYAEVAERKYFTARNTNGINIPAAVEKVAASTNLRVSSFPHIAGILVLNSTNLKITSSNSVFSAALFGHEHPDGLLITELIPGFDRILHILTDEDGVRLVDGIVIPEHSFRRARAFLALRDGRADAASYFLRPDGLPAKHRDGSEIKIDVQMRVVKSDKHIPTHDEDVIIEEDDASGLEISFSSEVVYALWITYSRNLHASTQDWTSETPFLSGSVTPLRQPSPGQTTEIASPIDMSDSDEPKKEISNASNLTKQLKQAALKTAAKLTGRDFASSKEKDEPKPRPKAMEPVQKKTIDDFIILEEMGQGAYGQVKLARYKKTNNKVVLKYVTKRRILVDTWTRDRRLGTVPLEIHVLDYLRRDGLKHPNIVEMADFFEDDVNYYIEMVPHGLPGMDLFDYIELRVNMEEAECRSIFSQVAQAIYHLHIKCLVVHRDIKDENVILDGEGNIKLIDFGSAAYIKNGPFDVFVGTIDYAAPEVLAGKPYLGKAQDVWALGILLYTIVYKENPFYSIDEIMDRDLRVPYIMSDNSINLIRAMLNRDVDSRIDIEGVLRHAWLREDQDEDD